MDTPGSACNKGQTEGPHRSQTYVWWQPPSLPGFGCGCDSTQFWCCLLTLTFTQDPP